jgi:hypothetical protein
MELITVQPRENEFFVGNDYPTPTYYNKPFFETTHNCELQKNDWSER